jgi:hypothetical protein
MRVCVFQVVQFIVSDHQKPVSGPIEDRVAAAAEEIARLMLDSGVYFVRSDVSVTCRTVHGGSISKLTNFGYIPLVRMGYRGFEILKWLDTLMGPARRRQKGEGSLPTPAPKLASPGRPLPRNTSPPRNDTSSRWTVQPNAANRLANQAAELFNFQLPIIINYVNYLNRAKYY